jgi:hypothetical protein
VVVPELPVKSQVSPTGKEVYVMVAHCAHQETQLRSLRFSSVHHDVKREGPAGGRLIGARLDADTLRHGDLSRSLRQDPER